MYEALTFTIVLCTYRFCGIPREKQVPSVSAPQAEGMFNHIAIVHFIVTSSPI
jgi:hypothetical protein